MRMKADRAQRGVSTSQRCDCRAAVMVESRGSSICDKCGAVYIPINDKAGDWFEGVCVGKVTESEHGKDGGE